MSVSHIFPVRPTRPHNLRQPLTPLVTVIEFEVNDGGCNGGSHFGIELRADTAELTLKGAWSWPRDSFNFGANHISETTEATVVTYHMCGLTSQSSTSKA